MERAEGLAADLLIGAFDTHVHCAPDVVDRYSDFFGIAQDALRAGMAGVAFKDVGHPTVDRAYAVRHDFPELVAAGGIVLDHPVGGLNPFAVEQCLKRGGRVVWMPVVHSHHMVSRCLSGAVKTVVPQDCPIDRSISIVSADGQLTESAKEIVALVGERRATLMTGHVSPLEALQLTKFALANRVGHVVVNHPCGHAIGASDEMQRDLADAGALMEHCYAQCTPGLDGLSIDRIIASIHAVGPDRCIIATDLGQSFNPRPVDGLRFFLRDLLIAGLSTEELRTMVQTNPGRIIDWGGV